MSYYIKLKIINLLTRFNYNYNMSITNKERI